MNDDGPAHLAGESYLGGERRALRFPRRVVVVIVEAALADRNRRILEQPAERGNIARLLERGRVVRVDASRRVDEAGMTGGDFSGERRCLEGLADADDSRRARLAGAGDYRVAVAGERWVREVGVAVDEDWRVPGLLRGHLRSIQRSTGAAT